MTNKPLLTIAIPTYNRAVYLKNLLDCIVPEVVKLRGEIEICISDNNSSDNTQEIIMRFKEKYPDLINYNKNEKNLGAERNLLLAIEMSKGEFVWFFGDDDLVVPNGLNDVVNFIKKNCKENTAFVSLREESYFFDEKTGKKIIYYNSSEPNKPLASKIKRENIIDGNFPSCAFMSALIFKNYFLLKMLKEEEKTIEKAVGNDYLPMFLSRLMFSKFSNIEGITFNKSIVSQELPYYKISIEDRFEKQYVRKRRLNRLLLSSGYLDLATAKRLKEMDKALRWNIVLQLILMKTFKTLFYSSYSGVLKKFFRQATLGDALLFSFIFLAASLTPSFILRNILKLYFLQKHGKNWKSYWTFYNAIHYKVSKVPILRN